MTWFLIKHLNNFTYVSSKTMPPMIFNCNSYWSCFCLYCIKHWRSVRRRGSVSSPLVFCPLRARRASFSSRLCADYWPFPHPFFSHFSMRSTVSVFPYVSSLDIRAVWLRFCVKSSQLPYSTRLTEELCGFQHDKAQCQISPACCPEAVSGTQTLHGLWVTWGGLALWNEYRFAYPATVRITK